MSLQTLTHSLAAYWQRVQTTLFPYLSTAGLTLTPEMARLAAVLDLLRLEEALPARPVGAVGAPPRARAPLVRAFLAQALLNLPTRQALIQRLHTDDTLRRLCGWPHAHDVPSPATFCRAFAWLADAGLADLVHDQRVQEFLGDVLVWHQAVDATDIPARETPHPNPAPQYGRTATGGRRKHPASGRPPGRPKAGTQPEPPRTRLERQRAQVPEIALLELPTACDTGYKPDAHGHPYYWVGYKFHVVTNEWGVPLAAVTTAASVHDSQAAIPLLSLCARRVTALYDLLDRGYDAAAIRAHARALGQVPLIPAITRPTQPPPPPWEADHARHYQGRTVAERFNARLKDEMGGSQLRVRGVRKVHAHLMLGLLGIFADALLKMAAG